MNCEIKNTSDRSTTRFTITSPDMPDDIVALRIGDSDDIFIVHDSGENVHQVSVPSDCIEALIRVLKQLKSRAQSGCQEAPAEKICEITYRKDA
jgi:hypothetical protein